MPTRLPTTLISRGRALAAGRDVPHLALVSSGHGRVVDEATAQRLAACYRACVGIPTDRLEWACAGNDDGHRLARLEAEAHRLVLVEVDRSLEDAASANA
jgi:hypothetical protein